MDEKFVKSPRGAPVPSDNEEPRWRRTFAALRYRNYRLWFIGQLLSLFGTWMQTTAQGFLVYQLTHSPAYLGYVGFAAGAPTWIFTLYAGILADRFQRRNVLIVTQTMMMVLAFVLATVTIMGVVQPWHIVALAALLGTANAFDAPARQAFATEMVEKEDLANAIALNATMFNTATFVGPAVAGVTYAWLGAGWCFAINGASFIPVIVALMMMHLVKAEKSSRSGRAFGQLTEGLKYIGTHRIVRTLIILVAATSLFGMSLAALLPAWAVNVLGGNSATNGLLYSFRGLGSLIGALTIASLGRVAARGRLVTLGSFLFPSFLFAFSLAHWQPLSFAMLVGVGAGSIFVLNLCNALVQMSTPDILRGRVMGAYSMIFFGCMPLGALFTGHLAELCGETTAVMINAGGMLLCAAAVRFAVPEIIEQ